MSSLIRKKLFIIFILLAIDLYSANILMISKIGKVFVLKESPFPKSYEIAVNTQFQENDLIMTQKNSKAFMRTSTNIPFIIGENSSLFIPKISNLDSDSEPFKVFIKLNFGEIEIISNKTFLATPLVLVEQISGKTVIIHNSEKSFSRVISFEGKAYVSKTHGLTERLLLNEGNYIDIEEISPSKSGELKVSKIDSKEIADKEHDFNISTLNREDYNPSFLDNFFRMIILKL